MSKGKGEKFNKLFNSRHTVRALKRENRILRAEIQRLSKIIKANSSDGDRPQSETSSVWAAEEKEAKLLESTTYLSYLVSKLTGGSLFSLSKRLMGYFRKFKLVGTVMRVLSSVLTLLGTGAFFIFISGALVFIIPLTVAFSATIYFFSATARRKAFRDIKNSVNGACVYVFFPTRAHFIGKDSPFKSTVDFISNDTNNKNFIIIVSPYVFSSSGLFDSSLYAVARLEKKNVYVLRKNSFFLLRKRVLGPIQNDVIYIY